VGIFPRVGTKTNSSSSYSISSKTNKVNQNFHAILLTLIVARMPVEDSKEVLIAN